MLFIRDSKSNMIKKKLRTFMLEETSEKGERSRKEDE